MIYRKVKTNLSRTLSSIEQDKATSDDYVKCILADPQIAAYIVQALVPEFKEMEAEKIIPCIGEPTVMLRFIEALNGILYIVVFAVNGLELTSIIYCFLTSALIVLSVIDWRTYEIPLGINIFILVLGILHVFLDHDNWSEYVIGFFCVSLFLEILLLVSGGRAIGGGDVKLMACAGLAIGWQNITLAFFLGCIIGSVIHLIRMKVTNAGNRLAMGPYLAAGIFISMLWGEKMISAYLTLAGF